MKLFLIITLFVSCTLQAETFPEKFIRYMNSQGRPASDLARDVVREHQFVFISGVLKEFVKPYFKRNSEFLTNYYGADKAPILSVGTAGSIEHCSTEIYKQLTELYKETGKPLVVISHSKGSLIINILLFKYPELVRGGIVRKHISLQGAYGGSKVADYVVSEEPHWTKKVLSPLLRLLGPIATPLTTEVAYKNLDKYYSKLSTEDHDLIDSVVYYVRSMNVPRKTVSYLRVFNRLLLNEYGKNDGMILIEDQMMSEIGQDLGVIENIDHIDFILDRPLSRTKAKTREVIMQLIVEEIFEF